MKKTATTRLTAALLALFLLLIPGALTGCGKDGYGTTLDKKIPDDGKFYLVVPDESAKPGETVTVKLALSGNPGVGGFSFCLSYDKAVFTASEGKVTVKDNAFSTYGDKEEGANFVWTSLTPYTEDGEFCEVKLTVADSAEPGTYPLKVAFRPELDSFYKIEGEEMPDLEIIPIDGSITIDG